MPTLPTRDIRCSVLNCLWARNVVLILAAITLAGSALVRLPGPVDAQLHGATRSFSATEVEPGGILEVSVFAADFGSFGQVMETLPAGFVYVGSDLPDSAVTVEATGLSFVLLGVDSLTYTVKAPVEEGDYTFSGIIKDQGKQRLQVLGADTVHVRFRPAPDGEGEPTPPSDGALPAETPKLGDSPTPAPPESEPQLPIPTAIPAAEPAATPTVAAATPEATVDPTAVTAGTPSGEPAARPTPTRAAPNVTRVPPPMRTAAAPTAEPAPPASGESDDMGGWIIWSIVGGGGGALISGLTAIWYLARRAREDRWQYRRW